MKEYPAALQQAIETVVRRAFPDSNVKNVSIKAGSNNGDNYLGVMYAIDTEIESEQKSGKLVVERKHLILKTSSANEARKEFGDNLQVFDKEAAFYRDIIPELMKFQEGKSNGKVVTPAFVKCYGTLSSFEINNRKCDGTEKCVHCQPALPWDYILMQDMREDGGYRMGDRLAGLDYDHCELVVSELARYHALNYAYIKTLKNKKDIFDKFPFLKESMVSKENETAVMEMYTMGKDACLKILEKSYPADSSEYQKLKSFVEGAFRISAHFVAGSTDLGLNEMLSTPVDLSSDLNLGGRERKERNQWLVLTHGDSWVNNFLFKYSGEKPIGVKLIDLQLYREICLTTDLSYFLYMSTTAELRSKHLNQLLGVYFNTFKSVCETLKVEPWADFTLENLKKKYKKAMLFGASTGLVFLPIVLLPKDAAPDLETESSDGNVFGSVGTKVFVKNENLENRILATAKECFAHGLFD